ncbi:MAG TPA: AEC family transporter [Solirubrobacterales bacterium]|nr:AEC family transporter [Solirubrobacterales bacterium]
MGVLLTVAVILVAAGVGAASELRWHDRAAAAARAALTASVFTLLPFVTFFNVARLHFDADIGIGILLGYFAIGIATALAWWAGRALGLPRASRGALMTCALIANTGYLGYPLTASLLGFDALGEAVAYDVLVGAPALLLAGFAVGAAFGDKAGESPRERVAAFFTRNPPLYAAVAGLLAPEGLAPDFLVDASRVAVVALLPIGFFAVGAILAEEAEEGHYTLGSPFRPEVSIAIVLRMVVAPGLLLAMAAPLIDLPGPYLLLAAMPVGINTLLVGHVYGLDLRLSAQAVAWSTVIAIVAATASLAV